MWITTSTAVHNKNINCFIFFLFPASKKLPCNHIFHTSCLRSWFQRQQTCPTCRLNILRSPNAQNATPQAGNPPGQQPQGVPAAGPAQPPGENMTILFFTDMYKNNKDVQQFCHSCNAFDFFLILSLFLSEIYFHSVSWVTWTAVY